MAGNTMTADQALQKLKEEWFQHIKNEVGNDRFESRLTDVEGTKDPVQFQATLTPYSTVKEAIERRKKEAGRHGIYYEQTKELVSEGQCWAFVWQNMLSGGWLAYVDAQTGKVVAIIGLVEG